VDDVWAESQAWPQLPQLLTSAVRSAQRGLFPVHAVAPALHAQALPEQVPKPHCCPQEPQLFASIVKSTHPLLQQPGVSRPPLLGQTVPQAPQLLTSPVVLRHVPPQHIEVVPQGVPSVTLLSGLSMHVGTAVFLHVMMPLWQRAGLGEVHVLPAVGQSQFPAMHWVPDTHTLPQPPQLALLEVGSTH
jgi:hypothetical protein